MIIDAESTVFDLCSHNNFVYAALSTGDVVSFCLDSHKTYRCISKHVIKTLKNDYYSRLALFMKTIAAASRKGRIVCIDLENSKEILNIKHKQKNPNAICLKNNIIGCGYDSGSTTLFDLRQGKCIWSDSSFKDCISDLSLCKHTLSIACADGNLTFRDIRKLDQIFFSYEMDEGIASTSIYEHDDDQILFLGGDDGGVFRVKIERNPDSIEKVEDFNSPINQIKCFSNSMIIATDDELLNVKNLPYDPINSKSLN